MLSSRIVHGDALSVLPTLPRESVQTVVTSPPYWGQRVYATEPLIWDASKDCRHEWGETRIRPVGRRDEGIEDLARRQAEFGTGSEKAAREANPGSALSGRFCTHCNAWLGELGLEPSIALYIDHLVQIFAEVKRVLRNDGTLWIVIGDGYYGSGKGAWNPSPAKREMVKESYIPAPGSLPAVDRSDEGLKSKDLIGLPWRLAFALQDDGWWLRDSIIWHKPNGIPDSCEDRTTNVHENIFLLSKRRIYYYDHVAVREPIAESSQVRPSGWGPGSGQTENSWQWQAQSGLRTLQINPNGRNRRSVWSVATIPYKDDHFATYPPKLIEPMILAGSSERGACAKCGAPWGRVIDREGIPEPDRSESAGTALRDAHPEDMTRTTPTGRGCGSTWVETLGWEPTCKCEDAGDPVPCLVLDPFNGTGTTGQVALANKRSYLGIEPNPDYIRMTQERLSGVNVRMIG